MRFSNHTIIVDDYPDEGFYLVYNTRTQAMVKINQELKDIIENYYSPEYFPHKVQNTKDILQLYRMGIIVESPEEDRKNIEDFFLQMKYSIHEASLPVTIVTTSACNFNCSYCFEESSRTNAQMDIPTSELVTGWIKRRLEKLGYQQVYLVFYGGEPLLNPQALEHIVWDIETWCKPRNIAFKFMLQTNGYLLTEENVDKYLEMGLSQIRVSVDGVGEDHDRNRVLRGGGGTFDKIMENITACADKVRIGISTSYDNNEVEHIARMLDYFEEKGILHKLGEFIFSPVHAGLGPTGHPEKIRHMQCIGNYEDVKFYEATTRIRKMMAEKKLPMKRGLSISACALTRQNSGVTIDQDGRIFRCNSMLGHPEFSVGDVQHDDFNEKQREFCNLDVWRKCPEDCTYLPMCGGGCRLMSFLDNQTFTTPACKKVYLDKITPELIKHDYIKAKGEL